MWALCPVFCNIWKSYLVPVSRPNCGVIAVGQHLLCKLKLKPRIRARFVAIGRIREMLPCSTRNICAQSTPACPLVTSNKWLMLEDWQCHSIVAEHVATTRKHRRKYVHNKVDEWDISAHVRFASWHAGLYTPRSHHSQFTICIIFPAIVHARPVIFTESDLVPLLSVKFVHWAS